VVVQADDHLTREGTAAFLQADGRVKLLHEDDTADAGGTHY
jgi:hypothetical protein